MSYDDERPIGGVLRTVALPIALGVAIMLIAVGIFWVLEVLLAGYVDYDRGLWEGAALILVMNGNHAIAHYVLRRVNARKKESA
jgi:hypothetical protein